jgi:hypothetical protein
MSSCLLVLALYVAAAEQNEEDFGESITAAASEFVNDNAFIFIVISVSLFMGFFLGQ